MTNATQAQYNKKQKEWALPRLRQVAKWHAMGLKPFEIAKLLSVTRERARQLIKQAESLDGS